MRKNFEKRERPSQESKEESKEESKDENLWRITPEQFEDLPEGTELTSISGDKVIKGKDYIDQDTRGGYLAFGFLESNKPDNIKFEGKAFIDKEFIREGREAKEFIEKMKKIIEKDLEKMTAHIANELGPKARKFHVLNFIARRAEEMAQETEQESE